MSEASGKQGSSETWVPWGPPGLKVPGTSADWELVEVSADRRGQGLVVLGYDDARMALDLFGCDCLRLARVDGLRYKSTRGVQFRKWANSILKQYIIQGYAVNTSRMNQLGEVIRIMKRTENSLDAKQVLSVIEKYSLALDLLDDYDHQTMKRPDGNKAVYILSYEECRQVIDSMKFSTDSDLFGNEKDDSFKGSIGNIY